MKILKRFAIVSLIILVLLLTITTVILSFFEDKIGKTLTTEINKQINSELSIEDFGLSVLTSFPNVAANLQGIVLKDNQDGVLLEAENLSFRFGLLSLLGSSISVKSVVIENGALNVEIDRRGKGNYEIFKAKDEEQERSETALSLENAKLKDIELIYIDRSAKQEIMAKIEEADFSGEFSSKQFSLNSKANIDSRFVELDGKRYFAGKYIGYDARILVDMEEKVYEFQEVELEVENNRFKVDGNVEEWENGTYYDLLFTCEEGNLESVLQLLPEEYLENLSDFRSSGQFLFTATLKGEANARKNPAMKVDLSLSKGKISSPRLEDSMKEVSFEASFTNGKGRSNKSSVFEIKNLKGYFSRQLLELKLKIQNLDDPRIDFSMDGILPIGSVYGLFNNEKITNGTGKVEIKNLQVNGRFRDMISTSRISRVNTGGQLEFNDAGITINGEKLIIDNGHVELKDNLMTIEGFKFEGAGSEMEFQGSAQNIIPVLFADSLNTKRAELRFQAKLQSPKLDIDRLINITKITEETKKVAAPVLDSIKVAEIQKRERITNFFKGTFDAVIQEFNFNKIEGKDFLGKLEFDNNELIIDGKTEAMGGSFDLDGHVYFEDEPHLKAKLICEDIDIKEFFRQSENFGQEVLESRHLKGQLRSKMVINAFWDREGNFLSDELSLLAGIGIEEGELLKFEMLESFSTFVKIKDLQRIKFTDMQNFLEYRNQKLHIPVMFIQSNALNLTINGEHTFENDIEYNIKVNAAQVIANRVKKHDKSLKPIKARKKGWFNLYYQIAGTIDKYTVKSAKKRIKTEFKNSEKRKKAIQEALEREFGIVELILEPEEWRDIPEYDNSDPDDVEYLDWGDEEEESDSTRYIDWNKDKKKKKKN